MDDTPHLRVKVYSQFQVYYEGAADSVSAASKVGPFDILPGHANFFTLLVEGDITIIHEDKTTRIEVSQGIAQVGDDYLRVFVDV